MDSPTFVNQSMSAFLSQLNPAQRKAAEHIKGPAMVIAGAGSGKTRVLTYRIAHIMAQGVDAFNILALTFTNKAAREMRDRIASIASKDLVKGLWMGTFHSVFARILRSEGHRMGYPSNFTIYDTEDSNKVIASLIKEMQLDKDLYKVKAVSNRISSYKNNLITVKSYAKRGDLQAADSAARMSKMGELYKAYTERCFRAGAMDFDDLLLRTNELFVRFPEALATYQDRFRYILVDEYQDTNHSQYLIIKALASRFENLFTVGDDAQSIYAFRGANIENILNFNKDYPDAGMYKLEQNYRSSGHIVGAANALIKANEDQLPKDIWTENPAGEPIVVHQAVSDSDEAQFVAHTIWNGINRKQQLPDQFAILYRTNAQSRAFEDSLRRRGIAYRIYGGLSFYQRKEVKDLLAYVRLCVNPNDEEAFKRAINLPSRGIGDTTMARLIIAANEQNSTLWDIACKAPALVPTINRPTAERILAFADMIKSYQILSESGNAFDVVSHIAKTSGLIKLFADDNTPEGVSRYENIQELLNGIKDFVEQQEPIEDGDPSLAAFIQDVALITDIDREDEDPGPKVSLMTVHLAKGLEFRHVFIVGLEENLFPSMMSMGSRQEIEEERRLFYVALTRAEKQAYLTHSHVRYRWGKLIDCVPSRFLDELDEKHLDVHKSEVNNTYQVPDSLKDAFGAPERAPKARNTFYGKAAESMGQRKKMESNKAKLQGKKLEDKPSDIHFKRPHAMKRIEDITNSKSDINTSAMDLNLQIKSRVIHGRFGVGVVTAIEGEGMDAKAVIAFEHAGEKKLLLKFAKLRLLSK